eukprot:CAMPEP_0178378656 /NCGR_PEP_ID=MMETSP0689_2-20121128/4541_1 /TAXON_ID=160604 /ORGANISM="Amphidinium massartii, Strain CS-259" /LENGTH=369 /DNA_ID=CAMNT_0019998737 /DNA_START=6 /DNA_END=1112 /DNA_ORIENTATION=+
MSCCGCCRRRQEPVKEKDKKERKKRPSDSERSERRRKEKAEKAKENQKAQETSQEAIASAVKVEIGDRIYQTIHTFKTIAQEEFSDVEGYLRQLRTLAEASREFTDMSTAPLELAVRWLQVQIHIWSERKHMYGEHDDISSRPSITCAESQKTRVVVRLACVVRDGNRLVALSTKLIRELREFFQTLDANRYHTDRAITDCASHLVTWPERLATRSQDEVLDTDPGEILRAADEQVTFAWIDHLETMRERSELLLKQLLEVEKFIAVYSQKAPDFVRKAFDTTPPACYLPVCSTAPASSSAAELLDCIRALARIKLEGTAALVRDINDALKRFDGQSFKLRVLRFRDVAAQHLSDLRRDVKEAKKKLAQ